MWRGGGPPRRDVRLLHRPRGRRDGAPEDDGGGVADATNLVNRAFDYGLEIFRGNYVQNAIHRMLNKAAYNCPHSPLYQRDFPGLVYQNVLIFQ